MQFSLGKFIGFPASFVFYVFSASIDIVVCGFRTKKKTKQ